MLFKTKLPPIYHSFINKLLEIEIPDEKIADCNNCTLCQSAESPYINTKCCTYYPSLANFLIGGILIDSDEALISGKKRIIDQINRKIGVTPYGLIPPSAYKQRKKELDSIDFWSKPKELNEAQLCPYFEEGKCTIWNYRENLCITHFCSSLSGIFGKKFWKKVNEYIRLVENALSKYALLKMDWKSSAIITNSFESFDFNIEDKEGNLIEDNYSRQWGEWISREKEFYINCYEKVQDLNAETFSQIIGLKRDVFEKSIIKVHKAYLKNLLPNFLILNPNLIVDDDNNGKTRLILNASYVEFPTVIFPLIKGFNGNHNTINLFHLGYKVLYNISPIVDELREKGMLLKAK